MQDYSQFTLDFISDFEDSMNDYVDKLQNFEPISNSITEIAGAMSYMVSNAEYVIRPELADKKLFKDLYADLTEFINSLS
jgi:hypothetical protein